MLAFWRLRHIKTKSLNWVKWSILSTLTSRGSTQCTQCIQHNLVWSFGQSGNSWTTQLGTARHRVLPHGTAHGFFHTAHGLFHPQGTTAHGLFHTAQQNTGSRVLRHGSARHGGTGTAHASCAEDTGGRTRTPRRTFCEQLDVNMKWLQTARYAKNSQEYIHFERPICFVAFF